MTPKAHKYLATIIVSLLIASCSTNAENDAPESPESLYKQATDAYEKKDYDAATEAFKQLEKEYPFSRFTKDSLIKTADAQFATGEYTDAINTFNRYMELYPGAPNSDYVLYQLGMSYYHQIIDPRRDHSISLMAKKHFIELLNRYPNSQYGVDGKIRLDFVNNQIAAKEMIVGRFYLKNDQYPAAINRFKYVVKHHQTTIHIKEALHRLVESYLLLGLTKPAYQAAALLGYNYPESRWYHATYKLMQKNDPHYEPQKPESKAELQSWWDKIL